ncbi:OmpA family protein [Pseudomonas stutzeri]|nr:OmpA family protein [Stutzerimonas stutzeri]
MHIARTAVPLVLASGLLTGCANLVQSDWPPCAAVGGVVGAGLGAIESATWAAGGLGLGALTGAAYCWVHGDADGDGVVNKDDKCPDTPRGTPVDASGCPQPVAVAPVPEPMPPAPAMVRVELDVKFDFDKDVVKEGYKADIRAVADFMREYPQTTTVVEGHTDSVGPDAYNQRLSERRANAVRSVLVNEYGVASERVDAIGYGESRPVADNATPEGRAINRRVEAAVEARP